MSLILNIETSSEKASIAIALEGETIYKLENNDQKDHAAWIQDAIRRLFADVGKELKNLTGVGITAGPGSYTGLRVGMATAKGICYALQIPLITISTLEAMAAAALNTEADLYCPLIDARRMEVYTALYDQQLKTKFPPAAIIINEHLFEEELSHQQVLFFGSGRNKVEKLISHDHAIFLEVAFDAGSLSSIINKKFNLCEFTDLNYSEPVYIKDVYINTLNKSL